MKRKSIALLLTVAMSVSMFVGCGSTETATTEKAETETTEVKETITEEDVAEAEEIVAQDASNLDGVSITFWHGMNGVNGEALESLVAKFNEENEYGITVVSEYQGDYDDTITKLKSAQMGNMGADLVQIYDIGTSFMIDSGWVTPMQTLIDADGFDVSVIEPNIAAYYSVDGSLYSMPFNSSTPLLYYNKDMFEKAGIAEVPTSLEGIGEIGQDLIDKGGATQAISIGVYGWYFEQFMGKQGVNLVDNGNGREGLATAVEFDSNGGALALLTQWNELCDAGIAPNVGDYDAAVANFSAGSSAIAFASTASLKAILNDVGDKFEVGTAYFPSVTAEDKGGVSIGGASLWALDNGDSAKSAATWQFVKFLVNAESQAFWNAATGYFPVTTESQNEQVYIDNMAQYPQFQTAIDQLHDSAPEYAGALLSVFSETRVVVEAEIENMLNDAQTPEDAVAAITEQVNTLIEDYNLVNG